MASAHTPQSPPLSGSKSTLINTDVDFERDGIQVGTLAVPYSHDRSGYGHIPIPIVVLKNGQGPSLLLTAGNHGDEYEGPIALARLIQRLSNQRIAGRLIVIPALNLPAVLNCSRTSPIDAGNLNRAFPGKRDDTITEMIAHYVTTELFPRVEIAIDLHAGGLSFDHLPTMLAAMPRDPSLQAHYRQLVLAFSAPRTMILDMLGEDRTFAAAAEEAGVLFLGGEFGGGGRCDPTGVHIIEDGLSRLLHHLRITPDETPPSERNDGRFLKVEGPHQYVFAPQAGIFEPEFALGDRVALGQRAGRLYDPYVPWNPPEDIAFNGQGTVMCARTFAGVEPGDCIAVLASDMASTDF